MRVKLLDRLQHWHFFAKPLYVLAIIGFVATFAWPIVSPELNTLFWFGALSGSAFLLSSAAILDIAHQHVQAKTGFVGWLSHQWSRLMFWLWFVASALLVLFVIKLIAYYLG
jgi:hypothetical protein